jgi:perosamine synthetase
MKVPLSQASINSADVKAVESVLTSGLKELWDANERFETSFQIYTQSKYASAVSSGTAGLILALKSLDIPPQSEIITPGLSFVASANAIIAAGYSPVFTDVVEGSYTMNVYEIESKISERTKVILPVHLMGNPVDMSVVLELAKKYNLYIVEDCCQALGTFWKGNHVGTLGDLGVFGFFPNKVITTGEGGMIIYNDQTYLNRIQSLRNHGKSPISAQFETLGINLKLDEMSATLGFSQMSRIKFKLNRRKEVAFRYLEKLFTVKEVRLPMTYSGNDHVRKGWFDFCIKVNYLERDELVSFLSQNGISTKAYFPSFDQLSFLKSNKSLKVAFDASRTLIGLPFFEDMTYEQIDYVCEIIKKYYGH